MVVTSISGKPEAVLTAVPTQNSVSCEIRAAARLQSDEIRGFRSTSNV